jgi:very-short-patch-repair endonuclease
MTDIDELMPNPKKESFIERAKVFHGDKYDYSRSIIVTMTTLTEIYCNIHKTYFSQLPKVHLRGCGCPHCGKITRGKNRRMNTEQFIEKAREIHRDRYDYSDTKYILSRSNVTIICRKHGPFSQKPNDHLGKKAGCRKCADEYNSNNQRSNTEDFIKKAKIIWGERWDYTLVEYIDVVTPVNILCKVQGHGVFQQTPNGHLSHRNGCIKCLDWVTNTEDFITKAISIHGNLYNYENTVWINAVSKVKIGCNIHGEFEQSPNNHLQRQGCEKCARRMWIFSTEDFIRESKKVHGDEYDYSLSVYTKMLEPLTITCKIHGNFSQSPSNHITHCQGCYECGRNRAINSRRKTLDEFIEESKQSHALPYDYSRITPETYVNRSTPVEIGCLTCNEYFLQRPYDHLSGSGCIFCRNKTELIIHNFLIEHNVKVCRGKSFDDCRNIKPLPFDFFLEEYNILLESDGDQHLKYVPRYHKKVSLNERQETDFKKMNYAFKKGLTVIRIYQMDVYNNSYDWKTDLLNHIKHYDTPQIIYLSKNNKYNEYHEKYIEYNNQSI